MTHKMVDIMGMELEEWVNKSCVAHFGIGNDWATLYTIESKKNNKGHATALLIEAKKYYENHGKKFGGSVALNEKMKWIYQKLNIREYA